MYYITFVDDWCSTVPQQWVNFENQTFLWPPKERNVTKAMIKNIQPQNNWIKLTYRRITGPYKTYDIARKVENQASYVSTSEEEQLNQSIENRQKRIIKRPLFHDELDDSSNDKQILHTTKKARRMPSPSSTNISAPNEISNIIKKENENITENSVMWLPPICKEEGEFEENACDVNGVNNTHDVNDIHNINDMNDVSDIDNCETQRNTKYHTCCEACRTTLKVITQEITKKLDYIINFIQIKNVGRIRNIDTQLLPALPLTTIEDFYKFEEKLQQDKEIRRQFKNKITIIGGRTYANKTRNIMKSILHDSVAKKITWTGKKQSIPVKDTIFAKIIIDDVISTENCSIYEVQKVVQEHLRHAGDRLNYLNNKNNINI